MRRRQRRERHRGAAPDPGGGNNFPRTPLFRLAALPRGGLWRQAMRMVSKKAREGQRVFKAGSLGRRFSGCAPACGGRPTFLRSGNIGVGGRDFWIRENDVFSAYFAAGNFCLPQNDVYQRSKNAADHQAARQTSLGRGIYFRRQARRMSYKPCLPYGVSGAEGPARLIKVSGRERGDGGRRPPFEKGGLLPPAKLLSLLTSLRGCRRRSSARCCLYGRCAWGSLSLR